MALLGTLLKNRRAGERNLAWNLPSLAAADTLALGSPSFDDGRPIPLVHAARRVGGRDLSPALTWTAQPSGTAQLLLLVEDTDAPLRSPFVHCLALVDPAALPSPAELPAGALSAQSPAPGVRVLRSSFGRGYVGPAPIRGHGPHHYHFELFALARPVGEGRRDRARPRAVLSSITGPVLARGHLMGTFQRR